MTGRVRAVLPSDFVLLVAGQALSWLGNSFQTVALAVAVVTAGGGPGDLGLVMASSVLALLLCSLFGGVWADRLQPQHVMVASDVVRCVAAGAVALMFATDRYDPVVLCVIAAVSSGAGAFFAPAMTALRPMLVAPERRQSANATLGMVRTVCGVVGPAAGGAVVATAGATVGFATNAVSFLASMVTVALIRARAERTGQRDMIREIGEGWREIRGRDWLLSGVLAAAVYHVANGVVLVLAQVVAVRQLGGAGAVGLIGAAEGLGGLLGAAVAVRYRPVHPLRVGWLALLLMPLWVLSYVWPPTLVMVLAGAVVGYSGLSFFDVCWETALQDHVPHHVLARVASWDTLTSFLAMPLGNVLAGPLARGLGYGPVLSACAVVLFAAGAAPLFVAGSRNLTGRDVAGREPVPVADAP